MNLAQSNRWLSRKFPASAALRGTRLRFEDLEKRCLLSVSGFGPGFFGAKIPAFEARTIDGLDNNQAAPLTGSANVQQIRFGYGDDFDVGANGPQIDDGSLLPVRLDPDGTPTNARAISNALGAQDDSIPSARLLTDWAFQWGQFITHDMDLTTTDVAAGLAPIENPGDPDGLEFIPFVRSAVAPGTGIINPDGTTIRRDVVNRVTSFIDGSVVYGSDPDRAAALRTFVGGRLATSANGKLLPLNTEGFENENNSLDIPDEELFLAGDIRANEQLGLTSVHTLFVREHNRLAGLLQKAFPKATDEQLYQMARRIVGAEIQAITYNEFLPAILGYDLAPNADAAVYDERVEADVTNAFAHAVFRFGHSQISNVTQLVNNKGRDIGDLAIDEAFFNPDFLKQNANRVDQILGGLASQVGQEVDLALVDGIRNNLFGPPGPGGSDLFAFDVQRGRDHGLPDYAQMLVQFRVVPAGTTFDSFDDLRPFISQANLDRLAEVYGDVNSIDLFVGILAETHLPNASLGALGNAIVANQFARLRDGDRFFFTNDPFFDNKAIRKIIDIDKVTLSSVIEANTRLTNLQDNVFFDKSVLIVEAPHSGATISAEIVGKNLSVTSNGHTTTRSLSSLSQVILVGSDFARDTFNVSIADANGRLENGLVIYAGLTTQIPGSAAVNNSPGDTLNVFGRLWQRDNFVVTSDATVDTATVTTLRRNATLSGTPTPAENRLLQTTPGRTILVNGNLIVSGGIEKLRLITLGGNDSTDIEPGLDVQVKTWSWSRARH